MPISTPTGSGSEPVIEGKGASLVKPPSIARPLHEFVKIGEDVPEEKNKPVEIVENRQTLIDTAELHFKHLEKIKHPPSGTAVGPTIAMQEQFYTLFQQQFKGKNLKDPEVLKQCAEQFVATNGLNIQLVTDLAAWDAMALQAATQREIKVKGRPKTETVYPKKRKIIMTADGFNVVEKELSFLEQHNPFISPKDVTTKVEFEMQGGNTMELGGVNTLISPDQKAFLESLGWHSGSLDPEKLTRLDKRLLAVANLRTELYVKTGLDDLSQIQNEINFLTDAPTGATLVYNGKTYRVNRIEHLSGERGTGSNVREKLEADVVEIVTDIKNQVAERIKGAQDEANKASIENDTVGHLEDAIKKLKGLKDMSEARKDAIKKDNENRLRILGKKLLLFTRKIELPALISEAQTAEQTARDEITKLDSTVGVPDEASVNLLEWAGVEGTQAESIGYLRSRIAQIKQLDTRQKQIVTLKEMFTQYVQSIAGKELVDQKVFDNMQAISDKIQTLTEERSTVNWSNVVLNPGDKPIEILLDELESQLQRREAAVTANNNAINAYKTAKQSREQLDAEKTKVDAEIADIATRGFKAGDYDYPHLKSEDQIDAEAKKLEKEKDNPSAIDATTNTEIQSMEALKGAYGHDNISHRDEKCVLAEQGELEFNYVSGTGWEKYPPVILRFAQIVWGKDILLPANDTNKERIAQVQSLLKSQKFLNIIVDKLGATGSVLTIGSRTNNLIDGKYDDLNIVFPAAAVIKTIDYKTLQKEQIEEIIEEMRKQALHIV